MDWNRRGGAVVLKWKRKGAVLHLDWNRRGVEVEKIIKSPHISPIFISPAVIKSPHITLIPLLVAYADWEK